MEVIKNMNIVVTRNIKAYSKSNLSILDISYRDKHQSPSINDNLILCILNLLDHMSRYLYIIH